MFKVIHNSEESFVKEAKKSKLPVRIGLWTKELEEKIVGIYVKITAVVDGTLHETTFPFRVLPSSVALIPEEREKIYAEFEEIAKKITEYLKEKGIKEVEIGSYYEAMEV